MRGRLLRPGVRQRQVRLREDALELADDLSLPHPERGLGAAEEELPALARRAVGGRVLMGRQSYRPRHSTARAAGTMHAMTELVASVRRHRQAIFACFMIVVVLLLLWQARGALPAFFIGLALAFVLDPGVTALARRGVPRWAGVLVSYVGAVAVIWAVLAFVLPPITAQAREFMQQLPELGASIGDLERALIEWYEGLPLPAELREALEEQLAASGEAIGDFLAGLLAPTINAVVRAATFLFGLVVVPVWLFYVLKDRESFSRAVASAMPPSWRADTENVLAMLGRVGGRWVRGQLLLGASIFLATAIGLTILTIIGFTEFGQFTLVLALIAGVLEWVPIIGPIIAAIPAILIGLTISPLAAVAAAVLYTVIRRLREPHPRAEGHGRRGRSAPGGVDPGSRRRRRALRHRRRHSLRADGTPAATCTDTGSTDSEANRRRTRGSLRCTGPGLRPSPRSLHHPPKHHHRKPRRSRSSYRFRLVAPHPDRLEGSLARTAG